MNFEKTYLSAGIDEMGRVYELNGEIFREIQNEFSAFYKDIINSNFFKDLIKAGLVETEIVENNSDSSQFILKHKAIKFASFYFEWSFDMLKDAALTTIALAEELNKHNLDLKDAHPYNILFDHTKPVFVDFSSITPLKSELNYCWKRGFFAEFIVPLLLMKKGYKKMGRTYFYMEDNPDKKRKLNDFLMKFFWGYSACFSSRLTKAEQLEKLKKYVSGIQVKDYKTRWQNYYKEEEWKMLEEQTSITNKEKSVLAFLEIAKEQSCKTLLDVASNEGWFSRTAENMGFDVIAFDYDEVVINRLYCSIQKLDKNILPIVMDFTQPTRAHGINNIWNEAMNRFACDVTISIAILHHLALCQNVTFDHFAEKINRLTKKYAIVEFIGRKDEHIQQWLKGKDWYTEEELIKSMGKYFTLAGEAESNPSSRKTFFFKKKN